MSNNFLNEAQFRVHVASMQRRFEKVASIDPAEVSERLLADEEFRQKVMEAIAAVEFQLASNDQHGIAKGQQNDSPETWHRVSFNNGLGSINREGLEAFIKALVGSGGGSGGGTGGGGLTYQDILRILGDIRLFGPDGLPVAENRGGHLTIQQGTPEQYGVCKPRKNSPCYPQQTGWQTMDGALCAETKHDIHMFAPFSFPRETQPRIEFFDKLTFIPIHAREQCGTRKTGCSCEGNGGGGNGGTSKNFVKGFTVNAYDPVKDFVQDFNVNAFNPTKDYMQDFVVNAYNPASDYLHDVTFNVYDPVKDFLKEFPVNVYDPAKDYVQDFRFNASDPVKDYVKEFTVNAYNPQTDYVQDFTWDVPYRTRDYAQDFAINAYNPQTDYRQEFTAHVSNRETDYVQDFRFNAYDPAKDFTKEFMANAYDPVRDATKNWTITFRQTADFVKHFPLHAEHRRIVVLQIPPMNLGSFTHQFNVFNPSPVVHYQLFATDTMPLQEVFQQSANYNVEQAVKEAFGETAQVGSTVVFAGLSQLVYNNLPLGSLPPPQGSAQRPITMSLLRKTIIGTPPETIEMLPVAMNANGILLLRSLSTLTWNGTPRAIVPQFNIIRIS